MTDPSADMPPCSASAPQVKRMRAKHDKSRHRRLTPEQRALLIDCLRRGLSPDETVAVTGLPRTTVWRYRNKSNDGLVPETRIGGAAHRYKKRARPRPKPNVVHGIPYARLVAGR